MKSFFVAILLCLSFMTVNAQNYENNKGKNPKLLSNSNLIESVIKYSTDGEKSRYSYTYDANGNITSSLIEVWKDSLWVNSTRTTTTFNAIGKPIELLIESWLTWQSGATSWISTYKYTITYDINWYNDTLLIEKFQDGVLVNSR